jgi:hypothetical protein
LNDRSRICRLCSALALLALAGASILVASVGAAPTGPTAEGVPAADAPILANFEEAIPGATQVFVNCPRENHAEMGPEPGEPEPERPYGPGFQCEVRYLDEGEVMKGQDEVEEHPLKSHTYILINVAVTSTAPPTWQRCAQGFYLKGSACEYPASWTKGEIKDEAMVERGKGHHAELVPRLLPKRFSFGNENGRSHLEAGFVTEHYECRAHAKRISRTRQKDSGTCFTRFGDGIRFDFEVEAPPLKARR